uniref:Uncharacterized protein n=1 Tax=Cajanus cajan TaxID=3821 RepID=A0A151RJB4_CAJCA|nr:hypothetical protein KK1_035913 [Cajanus cajan]
MSAPDCDSVNRPGSEGNGFGYVFTYGEGSVSVGDLVEAALVSTRRRFEVLALLRVAG